MNIDFIPHLLYTKNSLLHTLNIASRVVKNLPANARDMGSIPGSGRSSGGGNGNPLHYSCLEIPWTKEPCKLHDPPMGSQRVGHD